MFALLCSLVACALNVSEHKAALIPGTLFAAIPIPIPVPHINIPKSTTEIPLGFVAHSAITEIEIPDNISKIGACAFLDCKNLRQIKIPNTVTEIPSGFISECTSITEVNIPSSVKRIGDGAFQCTGLTYINIPNTVEEIEKKAFYFCKDLKEAHVSSRKINSQAFWLCKNLNKVILSDTVENIYGFSVFEDCSSLSEIKIASSVKYIDIGALDYIKNNNVLIIKVEKDSYADIKFNEYTKRCEKVEKIYE